MRFAFAPFRSAFSAFDHWVRDPVDPRPIAYFRAWFGFLALVNLLLLWPDMPMWLAQDGVLPPSVHSGLVSGSRLSVYTFMGYSDDAISVIRALGLFGGLGLLTGTVPQLAAFCMWLAIASFSWRNPHILHSGDNLLRIGSFFLMFAQSDGALSVPRYLAFKFRPGYAATLSGDPVKVPAWPQRILQLQLCVVYLVTGLWKAKGVPWQSGTAVGTVLQLGEFQRFPIPDFIMTPLMSQIMTYSTLVIELGFPFLIWVPRLRVPVLLTGLALHAGLDWVMNVQLFQWTITSYYLLFLRFDRPRLKSKA
jgi:hypothetical protein